MRTFAVSRGSIREALNRLEAEGVVTLTRNKGGLHTGFDTLRCGRRFGYCRGCHWPRCASRS